MSVRYKDYYALLGVGRDADAAAIRRAYRELAKRHHPDRAADGASPDDRFQEISEAYAVLGDPLRRAGYDALGAGLREGEPVAQSPPADSKSPRGRGDFSEFFTFLTRRATKPGGDKVVVPAAGDVEAELEITLEEAIEGVEKSLTLAIREPGRFGRVRTRETKIEVKVPPGIRDGQRLRIRGGPSGPGPGRDVFLRIRIAPHPRFSVEGDDLVTDLRVTPWEAALGATLHAPTFDGMARLKLPGGTSSGQRLRLKGGGMPAASGEGRGDLVYRVMIALPERLTSEERRLMEELAEISDFDARH
jgi:curved DNA-binding protein